MLTLIDEYTRKCLAIRVARRLNSHDLIETLADVMLLHGIPGHMRSDNGPECVAEKLRKWLSAVGAQTLYIEPGSPWENRYGSGRAAAPPGFSVLAPRAVKAIATIIVTTPAALTRIGAMNPSDSNLWDDVLLAIEDGQVVPIVGRDLLVVETENGPQRYHHLVAERLAADLRIPTENLPPDFDPNDVICAYEKFHGDPMTFNPRVVRIVRELKVPVPEPLRLLAEIPKFNLFISTSFDTLLEEAICKARNYKPAVVAFPPASQLTDFDDALLQQHGSVVFQILGRVSASASFALTDGQMLEQMHDFMSGPRRPDKLIARLKESHLLILGIGFPDWLVRFLIRFARAKPLWDSRSMTEVIAETGRTKGNLSLFLHHFSPQQSRVFTEGTAVDFIRELHRRWFERNPATEMSTQIAPVAAEKPSHMSPGSIFISYASEDRAEAFSLANALTTAGVEVWIDRRILPGDDYAYLIERHIKECSAFVPVLSRHTQTDDRRWFRKEWELARELAGFYFGTDRAFLFPVVVDGTPNGELIEFKRDLFRRSAARATGGTVPAELIEQLDQAQKAWRKQFTRA